MNTKHRGNGTGTVYRRGSVYVAVKTIGYYLDEDGKKKRRTVSKSFARKKDAIEALPTLGEGMTARVKSASFKDVYDKWIDTCTAGSSTIGCYRAAFKYFSPLYAVPAADVEIDDLQECVSSCPNGKRTKQNMKTCIGLIYKYGIPRGYFPANLNLSEYITVREEDGTGGVGLPDYYLEKIRRAVGEVPGADLVYAHCYLGFRPAEFLALKPNHYSRHLRAFVGGAKTDAGKNRTVTVSPKIQGIVDSYKDRCEAQFFCGPNNEVLTLRSYRSLFYGVLDALALPNPTYDVHGDKRHTYTPHSCRHTFATLMKRVNAAGADKLKLIGHTSEEMLRYYQDVPVEDLRKITDAI